MTETSSINKIIIEKCLNQNDLAYQSCILGRFVESEFLREVGVGQVQGRIEIGNLGIQYKNYFNIMRLTKILGKCRFSLDTLSLIC